MVVQPPVTEHTVEVAGGPLRVLSAGGARDDRVPVLLIHGGGYDNAAISWGSLMAPLSQDRAVHAIDLPGFGGSIDVPPVGGPAELADVADDVLEALGIARAIVIGVSMGGDVALNLALRHPDRVAGLVLIAAGGLVPLVHNPRTHRWAWRAAQLPDWLLLPSTRLANRFAGRALRSIVSDPSALPAGVVEEFEREARHPRAGIAYGRYNQATIGRDGMLNDLSARVHEIAVPTLLFHGAEDRMVDLDGSRRAAERMPRARLVVAPKAGHWAQLEATSLFLTETMALLAEVDAG